MAGIEKIKIPVLPKDLTIDAITPYLPYILEVFNKNKQKIEENWKNGVSPQNF